jgi:hypothetical protein
MPTLERSGTAPGEIEEVLAWTFVGRGRQMKGFVNFK